MRASIVRSVRPRAHVWLWRRCLGADIRDGHHRARRGGASAARAGYELRGKTIPGALPASKHGLRFHDLRHTCAALSIAAGAHPKLIASRLGHSTIQITLDRYGHLFPSVEEALADALDAAFTADAPESNVADLRQVEEAHATG
jgi:integrase